MTLGLVLSENANAIHNQGFIALGLMSVVFGYYLWSIVGLFPSILFVWAFLSGLYVSCYGTSPYSSDLSRYFVFSNNAIRNSLSIASVALFALCFKKTSNVIIFIALFSIMQSVLLLFFGEGAFYCQSIDASFVAITTPFFMDNKKWRPLFIPCAAAVLTSGSSAAMIALVLSVTLYFMSWKPLLAIGIYPFIHHHHALLYSNGRLELWRDAWTFFKEHSEWYWHGSGLGTYALFEPSFRSVNGIYQRWLYLHNDFLEIGFTLGGIGLALALLSFGHSLWKSRRNNYLFSSIATFGFCILTQPILHNVIGTLYAAFLVREANENK